MPFTVGGRDRVHRGGLLRKGRGGDGRRAALQARPLHRGHPAGDHLHRRGGQDRAPHRRARAPAPAAATSAARACSRRCSSCSRGARSSCPLNVTQHWNKHDFVQVDTSDILFICAGTFTDLHQIQVDRRWASAARAPRRAARACGVKELVEYGMLAELLGRLPVRVQLEELGAEELSRSSPAARRAGARVPRGAGPRRRDAGAQRGRAARGGAGTRWRRSSARAGCAASSRR